MTSLQWRVTACVRSTALGVMLCLLCSLRTRDLRTICKVLYNRGVLAMKYGDRHALSYQQCATTQRCILDS